MSSADENNSTSDNEDEIGSSKPTPVVMSMFAINMVLTVALNSLMLVVIHRQRELQDVMKILYQILATLNIFLGICWGTWPLIFYGRICPISSTYFPFPFHAGVMLIIACICGIHFVLYVIISKPLHYNTIITITKMKISVIIVLIITFLYNAIYLPIPGWPMEKIILDICLHPSPSNQKTRGNTWRYAKIILDITPPLSAMVFIIIIQIRILRIARKQTRAVADMITIARHHNQEEINVEGIDGMHCCNRPIKIEILRFYKLNRGIFTVCIVTSTIMLACISYVLLFATQSIDIAYNLIASSGTWIQALVYIIIHDEGRRMCCHLFHQLLPILHM